MLWKVKMCPSPLEIQINCFSLIYSFPVTAILIGWSVVINFIEHISMAHQLCHALFTQLELGIKRYTYWAGGQKYFYRPDLLASPCRMGSCVYAGCTGVVTGFGIEDMANCITVSKKIREQRCPAGGHYGSPQQLWWDRWDNCCCSPGVHGIFSCWSDTWGFKSLAQWVVRNTLRVIMEFNLLWCVGGGQQGLCWEQTAPWSRWVLLCSWHWQIQIQKKKKNEEDSDLRVKKVFHSITIFISKSDIPCLGILNACVEAGIAEGHFCWTEWCGAVEDNSVSAHRRRRKTHKSTKLSFLSDSLMLGIV